MGEEKDQTAEIREAVVAGERALRSLGEAERYLASASRFGLWDILGGGLFATFMKHDRYGRAQAALAEAKRDLASFGSELEDVAGIEGMESDIGAFLTFADYFIDGIFFDVLVQSKIERARGQVDEAIGRVRQILSRLRALS